MFALFAAANATAATRAIRIVEIAPRAGEDAEWLELEATEATELAGWQLVSDGGAPYAFPPELPPLEPGARVLVVFDGQGSDADDTDLSDGLAILHAPPGALGDEVGHAALYTGPAFSAETIHDFVAWGAPPGELGLFAAQAGVWPAEAWVSLHPGSGVEFEGAPLAPDLSAGLLAGREAGVASSWTVYLGEDRSPGGANPVPRPTFFTPDPDAALAQDGFALGWWGLAGAVYRFQLSEEPGFGAPFVDLELAEPVYSPPSGPPPGAYFWRVLTILDGIGESAWSAPLPIEVVPGGAGPESSAGPSQPVAQRILTPLTWLRQRKDTDLLCLDGDDEAPAAGNGWDVTHPDAIYAHGRNNCVRASIAMVVTQYGGDLSQDRIAYEYFERNGNPIRDFSGGTAVGNPHADLGHDLTTIMCGNTGASGGILFAWAMGLSQSNIGYGFGKPSFAQVRAWLDADRPIMAANDPPPGSVGHMRVIAGYRIQSNGTQQVRVFDPASGQTWQNYGTFPVGCRYVPPASAPSVRSDEAGIALDTDGDGITDWDEQMRFGTSPTVRDSDGDRVPDKADVREYVFDAAGRYWLRSADVDADGLRKERDADNDGDGFFDGCEDWDGDGRRDVADGESSNFAGTSDGFEPNDTASTAAAVAAGSFAGRITPGDLDFFQLTLDDFYDVELELDYPLIGGALEAEFDEVPASTPASGRLVLDRSRVPPGARILEVAGATGSAANCYVGDLALQASTLAADRFDDQLPIGEPRNDTFANRTMLPDGTIFESVLLSSSVDDLNFDVANDVDWFDALLPPQTNPQTGQSECLASPPSDPAFYQGYFEVRALPSAAGTAWPFEIRATDASGATIASTAGGSLVLECPQDSSGDRVRLSVRAQGGRRNFYDLVLYYTRWNALLDVPPWLLELVRPPLVRELPPLPNEIIPPVPFPRDPEDYARALAGEPPVDPPVDYALLRWEGGTLTLRLLAPLGASFQLTVLNEEQEIVGVTGFGAARAAGPAGVETLVLPDLPPGVYVLAVTGDPLSSYSLAAGPPPADDAADAPLVGPGRYALDLAESTPDGDTSCQAEPAPDVWLRYRAEASGTLVVRSCGTHDLGGTDLGVDALLSVHREVPGTPANELACNDDWPSGSDPGGCEGRDAELPLDAALRVAVEREEEVWIRASRFAASSDGLLLVEVLLELADSDEDGIPDEEDVCPFAPDPGQEDVDEDGVGDACDDCIERPDPEQLDTDEDGYGNACDPDYNNDGAVGIQDFNRLRAQFNKTTDDPDFDPVVDSNGDGAIGIPDFNLLRALFGGAPGPSALR
ncbi:MAG: C39 family peptidase [Myxococcota bacterium]|nr:C39 family peptidase [Myxococcota bacterium]